MMNISWTEKINENVFGKARVKPSLTETITQRKMQFVGHIYRKNHLDNI